jgi:hypothetical protein
VKAAVGTALIGLALFAVLGNAYGFIRTAVALAVAALIVYAGIRYLRTASTIPPEPELTPVGEYGLKYVCGMCGLELKVEVAAHDRAPRHCGEPMTLVRTGGKPPLRPV